MRSLRVFGIAVAAAASGVVAPVAVAGVQLTLPAGSIRGWHATGTSLRLARRDLAAGLPQRIAGKVAGAQAQTSAASGPTGRLRSDAFVFASANTAQRVLAAWRIRHHARPVKIGAVVYLSARGRATVVAWRDGARIGVISFTGATGAAASDAHALADAVLADGWLRAPLPTTAWDKVLDQIRPTGTVSKQTALEAFASCLRPAPGSTASGRPANQDPVRDARDPVDPVVLVAAAAAHSDASCSGGWASPPRRWPTLADYGDPTFHIDYALQSSGLPAT